MLNSDSFLGASFLLLLLITVYLCSRPRTSLGYELTLESVLKEPELFPGHINLLSYFPPIAVVFKCSAFEANAFLLFENFIWS